MLVRIKYAKTQAGRFMSHLDLLRTMERSFRRARLPLAFSEGFNPHPKISFASALAVGVTSEGEYLDVELRHEMPLVMIKDRLAESVPPGIKILELRELKERKKSLTAVVNRAAYRVETPNPGRLRTEQITELINVAMNEPDYFILRQGKKGSRQVNIRRGIYKLEGVSSGDKIVLQMEVITGSEANVKPEEVVEMLRAKCDLIPEKGFIVHRLGLFVHADEVLKTPLETDKENDQARLIPMEITSPPDYR